MIRKQVAGRGNAGGRSSLQARLAVAGLAAKAGKSGVMTSERLPQSESDFSHQQITAVLASTLDGKIEEA